MRIMCFVLVLFLSFPLHPQDGQQFRASFMTYNVENLFDTTHDNGKHDFTFLPLNKKNTKEHKAFCKKQKQKKWITQCLELNWDEAALITKLSSLKKVIESVNSQKGPDVLILQEVENIEVLKRLQKHLTNSGYKYASIIEGPDIRGIDVGILSRFKIVSEKYHPVQFESKKFKDQKDRRGFLEVVVELPEKSILRVIGAHFPAPFHNKSYRISSYEKLNDVLTSQNIMTIAGGDFNTPSSEDKKHGILKSYVNPFWLIAHQEGCAECKGTTYYAKKKEWSFLDMLLLSKDFKDQKDWELDASSVKVVENTEGVSDHLPLYLEIKKQASP